MLSPVVGSGSGAVSPALAECKVNASAAADTAKS